eukprot:GHVU01200592.1.p1 GENE.GHVU01200592.1~~GHVU01200592.1.p1  ORF type:complete len:141 (+),score=3.57 GHVU01200592.1:215-637(+)
MGRERPITHPLPSACPYSNVNGGSCCCPTESVHAHVDIDKRWQQLSDLSVDILRNEIYSKRITAPPFNVSSHPLAVWRPASRAPMRARNRLTAPFFVICDRVVKILRLYEVNYGFFSAIKPRKEIYETTTPLSAGLYLLI